MPKNSMMTTNRFLVMEQQLRQSQWAQTATQAAPFSSAAPRGGSRGGFARPFSADTRALVVLMENGGVDLGIHQLVDAILSQLPELLRPSQSDIDRIVHGIRQAIREVTDGLLESAELTINRYTAAKPDFYGEVTVLRNGTAFESDLSDTLIRLTREQKVIDLFVLTHGGPDSIALTNGREITSAGIRGFRTANGNAPLHLRSVYMMNCYGQSLNQAWLDIGAKVSSGSVAVNYLPEPSMFFFFRKWKAGQSFHDAVTGAYRDTIAAINRIISSVVGRIVEQIAGPIAGSVSGYIAELVADLENKDFIKQSAPQIAGDGSLTIHSDALVFSQSHMGIAQRSVPRGQALSTPSRSRTWLLSQAGIEFIKSFEGFRGTLYNDPAGHCTIGYGTLVHQGNCDGRASEEPYLNGISRERATELLMERINVFQRAVNDLVKVELEPHQYDALVSFTYNVGPGNFQRSTLLRKLNEGDYAAVPDELAKWVKAGGQTLPGLVRRRNAEANLFTLGVYSTGQNAYARPLQQSRGIRNNNPGNLRLSNEKWEGKISNEQNTDGAFEQFTTFAFGVRALILLLRNYIRGGRDTIRKIINSYAPASDNNDTERYISFVVNRLVEGGVNVSADTVLAINRLALRLLAQGIARMENGVECISDAQFDEGYQLLPEEVRQSIAQSLTRNGNFYKSFGEVDSETEGAELEDIGPGALELTLSIPAHCPIREAETAETEHFRLSEFTSRDGVEVPRQARGNIQMLMEQLEVLRSEVGAPIRVVSGYRSLAHNNRVRSARSSQHLCGTAADIQIRGFTPEQVRDKIEQLISAGRMLQGGLGIYNTFVHYDIRGHRQRWDERTNR